MDPPTSVQVPRHIAALEYTFAVTTQLRVQGLSNNPADEEAHKRFVKVDYLDHIFNGLFSSGALIYLLLIQLRFRIIHKIYPYSHKWDIVFVTFTILLCAVCIYFGAIADATVFVQTIAGSLWITYVFLSANILSFVFLYRIYQCKQQTSGGKANREAFARVTRALAFICTCSWVCLALAIVALVVLKSNELLRPLVFRISYGVGGPLDLSGVLVFIHEMRNLVLSPPERWKDSGEGAAPAGEEADKPQQGCKVALHDIDAPAPGHPRNSLAIAAAPDMPSPLTQSSIWRAFGRHPSIMRATSSQELMISQNSNDSLAENAEEKDITTPGESEEDEAERNVKITQVRERLKGWLGPRSADIYHRPGTGSSRGEVSPVPAWLGRNHFALDIRNWGTPLSKDPRTPPATGSTVSGHSNVSHGVHSNPATSIASVDSMPVTASTRQGNVPTTPHVSFASQVTCSGVQSNPAASFASMESTHVPPAPRNSFASSTAGTRQAGNVPATPDVSFSSQVTSYGAQSNPATSFASMDSTHVPPAPRNSYASSTVSTRQGHVPATPNVSFASQMTSYGAQSNPATSFASVESTHVPPAPRNSYASSTVSTRQGNVPATPNVSFASQASSYGGGGNVPATPNVSFASHRLSYGNGNVPATPNVSFASQMSSYGDGAGTVPATPNVSFASTTASYGGGRGNVPATPHVSFASQTASYGGGNGSASSDDGNVPTTPHQSFASSTQSTKARGGVTDTPVNSFT
ncbi:hypothetical protein HK104_003697 [Borealophlyctis nickersoniae]|nr:hypothetical protein HK104_003697 [Borealophlyctis nickersoniae]